MRIMPKRHMESRNGVNEQGAEMTIACRDSGPTDMDFIYFLFKMTSFSISLTSPQRAKKHPIFFADSFGRNV